MESYEAEQLQAAIQKLDYLSQVDSSTLANNSTLLWAVLRCFRFVGEALNSAGDTPNITQHLTQTYSQIPWQSVTQLRHKLTHYHYNFYVLSQRNLLLEAMQAALADSLELNKQLKYVLQKEGASHGEATDYELLQATEFAVQLQRELDAPLPEMNALDYIQIAISEVERLAQIISEQELSSVNMLQYAAQSCIENAIQAIKDTSRSEKCGLPKGKASKIILALRVLVNSDKSLEVNSKLFFTRLLETRNAIAHGTESIINVKELYDTVKNLIQIKPILKNFYDNFNTLLKLKTDEHLMPQLVWGAIKPYFETLSAASSQVSALTQVGTFKKRPHEQISANEPRPSEAGTTDALEGQADEASPTESQAKRKREEQQIPSPRTR